MLKLFIALALMCLLTTVAVATGSEEAEQEECLVPVAFPSLRQNPDGPKLRYALATTTVINNLESKVYILAATALDDSQVHVVEAEAGVVKPLEDFEVETAITFPPSNVAPIVFHKVDDNLVPDSATPAAKKRSFETENLPPPPKPGDTNSPLPPGATHPPESFPPSLEPTTFFDTQPVTYEPSSDSPTSTAWGVSEILFMFSQNTLLGIDVERGLVHIFAGTTGVSGTYDGTGLAATFGRGGDIALADIGAGKIYMSDTENHCIRRYDIATYMVSTVAGTCGVAGSWSNTPATQFTTPMGIAYFADKREIFVSERSGKMRAFKIAADDSVEPDSFVNVKLMDPMAGMNSKVDSIFAPAITTMSFYPSFVVGEMSAAAEGNIQYNFQGAKELLIGVDGNCHTFVLKSIKMGEVYAVTIPIQEDHDRLELPDTTACTLAKDGTTASFNLRGVVPIFGGNYIAPLVTPIGVEGTSTIVGQDVATCTKVAASTGGNTGGGGNSVGSPSSKDSSSEASNNTTTVIIVVVVVVGIVLVVIVVGFIVLKKGEKVHPEIEANKSMELSASTLRGSEALTDSTMPMEQSSNPKAPSYPVSIAGSQATTAATINVGEISLMGLPEDENERKKKLCEDGRFQKNKLLGRGANGSVYSCVLLDGSTVAMKEVLLPSNAADLLTEIQKEVDIVSDLHHPHVVEYYGCRNDAEDMKLLLFMEIVSAGSVASMARNVEEPLNVEIARAYARQMVEAVAYIHGKGVVHRDIKCDNVLLTSEGICKLADFGASKVVGNTAGASRAANTMIGTPFFMAPEILTGAMVDDDDEEGETGYGKKADIWSLGITILELMNRGNPPWPDFPNQGAAFMHIASDEGVPVIPDHVKEHAEVVDFIEKCCVRDPRQRWTANDLLGHPWLEGTTLEAATQESTCFQMDHGPGELA